jgi:hypothetical protein
VFDIVRNVVITGGERVWIKARERGREAVSGKKWRKGYQDEGDGLVEVLRDLLGGDQVVLLALCKAREQKEKVEAKRRLVTRRGVRGEVGEGGKEEEKEDDDRGVRTRRPQRALPQLPMFVSFFLSEGGPPLQQNEETNTPKARTSER